MEKLNVSALAPYHENPPYFIGYYLDPERHAYGPFNTRMEAARFAREQLRTPPMIVIYDIHHQALRDISGLCQYTQLAARRPEDV